jgi:XTP/dITP diphosphohydrolase
MFLNKNFVIAPAVALASATTGLPIEQLWLLNTSNPGKLKEFERLFAKHGAALKSTQIDLHEILADPVTVVVHKASQVGDGVLIEDTSLDVEGADVGVNVRWLLENLKDYEGRKAVWRALLAYQKNGLVYVYEGITTGTIVQPRGDEGFGFDPVFLPDGAEHTLAQQKSDAINARAKAVEALFEGSLLTTSPPLTNWEGTWQD